MVRVFSNFRNELQTIKRLTITSYLHISVVLPPYCYRPTQEMKKNRWITAIGSLFPILHIGVYVTVEARFIRFILMSENENENS